MIYNKNIKGRYVLLRSIEEKDAEFSMLIRQDNEKTKYLHPVDANIEKQTEWIRNQRTEEGDYFFIVEDLDGRCVGTVGIYDINGSVGHLGRLLMIGNPFQTFEAVILSMRFAFDALGLEELYGDVHVDNTASMNISEAVGFHFGEPIYEKELDRWAKYGKAYKNEFSQYEEEIRNMIYRD